MRRKALGIFAALSLLWMSGMGSLPALAAGYEPLVQIPGVDEEVVDISSYLLGIYNFLLSIVGIVAVVMLIIGGMKYITAAGSGGAVSSAKETIKDALFGLLLALLSYVIVGTINPDVLYLRQPGAALVEGKDQNIGPSRDWIVNEYGTFALQEDGAYLYTNPEGVTVLIEDNEARHEDADELVEMISNGQLEPAYTEEQLVGAMERQVSCIAAGSPSGVKDPNYHGKCVCAVGNREVVLEQATVDAGGGCNEQCEMKGLCGYKFLSVKINARHGYDQDDGSIGTGGGAGSPEIDPSATPLPGATEGNEITVPTYTLTSDTAIHSDELWEMTQTNDPKWGKDFDITFETDAETGKEKRYLFTDHRIYPCALLITNEEEFADDEHWIYWVPLGTVVGGNEFSSLYYDLNGNYQSDCTEGGGGLYGIANGDCDQAWTDRVMLARYGDDIVDKCDFCNLADEGSIGKAYRWVRPMTCRGGYWQ